MATPSSKLASKMKKKTTSLRRRRNQKAEIDELASHFQSSTPLTAHQSADATEQEGISDNKTSAIDKLSVLRLTTAFLKFQNFLKDISPSNGGHVSPKKELIGLMEEAIDGFLIVLDKDANILYVSETILECVGLRQQDLIGQNLVDSAHSLCADDITDSLRPSITFWSSAMENCVVAQPRQFHLIFKLTASNTRDNSYTMVLVHGNLKVKIPPMATAKTYVGRNGQMEVVEPSVIGFVGICELVESATSVDDIMLPVTSFTWSSNLEKRRINSIEKSVKDVLGFSFDVFKNEDVRGIHFTHPEDLKMMKELTMKYLIHAGTFVSPHFRVMSSSGLWIWIRATVTLQHINGTAIAELKCRALSQGRHLKYITQREVHASVQKPGQDPFNPHIFSTLAIPKPITTPTCRPPTAAIDSHDKPLPSITVSHQSSFIVAAEQGSAASSTLNIVDPISLHLPSRSSDSPSAASNVALANTHPDQTSGHFDAIDGTLNAMPQTVWGSPPGTISNSLTCNQGPQYEPLNRQDLDSSPPLSDSSTGRSSAFAQVPSSSSTTTPTHVPQQDFQYQSHTHANQLGMCPPFNTSTSTTSSPSSTFELGLSHADSASMAVDQFQNSHQAIPHGSYDFNPQIPIDFDFSSNTAPYYPSNYPNSSAFGFPSACGLNGSADPSPSGSQMSRNVFNPAIYPSSSFAQNGPSAFNAMYMAPVVDWSVNNSSSDQPQNVFQQFM